MSSLIRFSDTDHAGSSMADGRPADDIDALAAAWVRQFGARALDILALTEADLADDGAFADLELARAVTAAVERRLTRRF